MTVSEIMERATEHEAVALTLWGECRAERERGQIAVGCVIRNRVLARQQRFGLGWKGVCFKRWQFSCWLPQGGAANHEALLKTATAWFENGVEPPTLQRAFRVALLVMEGVPDPTNGADHYYAPAAMVPPGRVPDWAKKGTLRAVIDRHRFFKA